MSKAINKEIQRKMVIIFESIVWAIAALIAGSMIAGFLTDMIQLPVYIKEACANIIKRYYIISDKFVVRLN